MNLDNLPDARYVDQRKSFLARDTRLRRIEARSIAWAELGYTRAGMASDEKLNTSESTVQTYHEKALALYGFEILEWRAAEDIAPPSYSRVDPAYLDKLKRPDQRRWLEAIERHENALPSSWVDSVFTEVEERNLSFLID